MVKLTKRVVDAAEIPDSGQVFIWDDTVKGFGLRVSAGGAKSYILSYWTQEGRKRRFTIGRHGSPWTCDDARQRALELKRGLSEGVDPQDAKIEARDAMTVAQLWEFYSTEGRIARPNKKASSWDNDRTMFERHIIPLIGKRTVRSLTKTDIARMQADISAGKTAKDEKTGIRGRAIVRGGRSVASHAVVALRSAINLAMDVVGISDNPASQVERHKAKKRERFLSEVEVALIGEAIARMEDEVAISSEFAAAIRLLMLTGCRKNEILNLQWSWIDMQRGFIEFPDSKTGAKVTPLPPAAMEIIQERWEYRTGNPYVLPSKVSARKSIAGQQRQKIEHKPIVGLQKVWEEVRALATRIGQERATDAGKDPASAPDLSDVRIHDLRHSFASFAVASGNSLPVIGKILGHRQVATTAIYAHLHDDPVKQASEHTAHRISEALKVGATRDRPVENVIPIRKRKRSAT